MGLILENFETNSAKFAELVKYIDQAVELENLKGVHWALHQVVDLFIGVSDEPELSAEMAKFLQQQAEAGNFSRAHSKKMLNLELSGAITAADKFQVFAAHIEQAGDQYTLDTLLSALIGVYANERNQEKPDDRTLAKIELLLKEQNDQGHLNDFNTMKMVKKRIPFGMKNNIVFMQRLAFEVISDDGRQVVLRMEEGGQPTTLYHPRKPPSPDELRQAKARREANRAVRDEDCKSRRGGAPKKAKA